LITNTLSYNSSFFILHFSFKLCEAQFIGRAASLQKKHADGVFFLRLRRAVRGSLNAHTCAAVAPEVRLGGLVRRASAPPLPSLSQSAGFARAMKNEK
jgi:hypothetical protein